MFAGDVLLALFAIGGVAGLTVACSGPQPQMVLSTTCSLLAVAALSRGGSLADPRHTIPGLLTYLLGASIVAVPLRWFRGKK